MKELLYICGCKRDSADIQLSNNAIFHNGNFGICDRYSLVLTTENPVFENTWWEVFTHFFLLGVDAARATAT